LLDRILKGRKQMKSPAAADAFKLSFVYRTYVSSAGPVPLAACKYAMMSPA
jgi:hypothetical protein